MDHWFLHMKLRTFNIFITHIYFYNTVEFQKFLVQLHLKAIIINYTLVSNFTKKNDYRNKKAEINIKYTKIFVEQIMLHETTKLLGYPVTKLGIIL